MCHFCIDRAHCIVHRTIFDCKTLRPSRRCMCTSLQRNVHFGRNPYRTVLRKHERKYGIGYPFTHSHSAIHFRVAAPSVCHTFGAIVATPFRFAVTDLCVQIECAVAAAIGQTLQCILIHYGTVQPFPSLFANARSFGAVAVSRAGRMRTIDCENNKFKLKLVSVVDRRGVSI